MNTINLQFILSGSDLLRAAHLQHEIETLREARECVTDTSTPAIIYGRVDDLITRRQQALEQLVRDARQRMPLTNPAAVSTDILRGNADIDHVRDSAIAAEAARHG